MGNIRQPKSAKYNERQAKRWLTWLARGMQSHGQTVFMLEQLQPSWLTPAERWTYILISRSLVGLLFGLIFEFFCYQAVTARAPWSMWILLGPASGIFIGLITGALQLVGMNRNPVKSAPASSRPAVDPILAILQVRIHSGYLSLILFALMVMGVLLLYNSEQISRFLQSIGLGDAYALKTLVGIVFSIVAFVMLFSMRVTARILSDDIQTVETLGWSSEAAIRAGKSGIKVGQFFARVFAGVFEFFGAILGVGVGVYIAFDTNYFGPLKTDTPLIWEWALAFLGCMAIWLSLVCCGRILRWGLPASSRGERIKSSFRRTMIVRLTIVTGFSLLSIVMPKGFGFASGIILIGIALVAPLGGIWISALTILVIGAPLALVRAVFTGMKPGIQEMKTIPNQGMLLTLRSAVAAALLCGIVFALVCGAAFEWVGGMTLGLKSGVVAAILFGLFSALWYGGLDVMQHYVLRAILYFSGRAPLNYVRFLDHAAKDLNFLQKVGGGYIFIHRILLEHFAAMDIASAATVTTPIEPSNPNVLVPN